MMTQTWRDKARAAQPWLGRGLAAYICLLHLALLILVLKTNFLTLAGKTLGIIPPEEWNDSLFLRMLDAAKHDKQSSPGAVVLIGDSLVASLGEVHSQTSTVNLAIGGDTVRTLKRRLPTLRAVDAARVVVVGVGVNDLKYRRTTEIAHEHAGLLAELPAGIPVISLAVLPVDEQGTAARQRNYLRNDFIRELNGKLRLSCNARSNCRYLDVEPAFFTEDGKTRRDFYAQDGWHLSKKGAQAVSELIFKTVGPS